VTEETAVVTLVAVRLEADETIQLAVRCSTEPVETSIVSFVAAAGPRTQRARRRFLDSVCRPSFEGWTLLYGEARLTVTDPGQPTGSCPQRQALDFDLVEVDAGEPA
jgi:hypothetical protein